MGRQRKLRPFEEVVEVCSCACCLRRAAQLQALCRKAATEAEQQARDEMEGRPPRKRVFSLGPRHRDLRRAAFDGPSPEALRATSPFRLGGSIKT